MCEDDLVLFLVPINLCSWFDRFDRYPNKLKLLNRFHKKFEAPSYFMNYVCIFEQIHESCIDVHLLE